MERGVHKHFTKVRDGVMLVHVSETQVTKELVVRAWLNWSVKRGQSDC